MRLKSFIADPSPVLPILEKLKDDPSLYVRRSVANHLGDIAKDHFDKVCDICEAWLRGAVSEERKWLIRHALRHPAKKGDGRSLTIRERSTFLIVAFLVCKKTRHHIALIYMQCTPLTAC